MNTKNFKTNHNQLPGFTFELANQIFDVDSAEQDGWSDEEIQLFKQLYFGKKINLTLLCPHFPNKSYNQILLLANQIERQMNREIKESLEKQMKKGSPEQENLKANKNDFSVSEKEKTVKMNVIPEKKKSQSKRVHIQSEQQEVFQEEKPENKKIDKFECEVKNQGKWTEEEHNTFLKYYDRSRLNNEEVARYVRTRSPGQVRSHAQKFFNKKAKERQERENQERGMRAIQETGGKTLTRNQKNHGIEQKSEPLPLKKQKLSTVKAEKKLDYGLDNEYQEKSIKMEQKRKKKLNDPIFKVEEAEEWQQRVLEEKKRKPKLIFSPTTFQRKKVQKKADKKIDSPKKAATEKDEVEYERIHIPDRNRDGFNLSMIEEGRKWLEEVLKKSSRRQRLHSQR